MVVPEPQAVIPNTTVRFKSTFKGTPPFIVKWFKEDTELITGPSCFIGLEGLSSFIDLYAVGLSNTGSYSCQVGNDAGTAKCTTSLLVKGWTLFLLHCHHINLFLSPFIILHFTLPAFCLFCCYLFVAIFVRSLFFILVNLHLVHASTCLFLAAILCSSFLKPSSVLINSN